MLRCDPELLHLVDGLYRGELPFFIFCRMLWVLDLMAVHGDYLYVCKLRDVGDEIDSSHFHDFRQISGEAPGQLTDHIPSSGGLECIKEGASSDIEELVALEPFAPGAGLGEHSANSRQSKVQIREGFISEVAGSHLNIQQ